MLLSVANSRPKNIESVFTASLYPDAIQQSASSLVNFIEEYYAHLNAIGGPSGEIASITREKDIDLTSDRYLTELQSLISRNIPNSRVLDKVSLYRIIVQYYNTRGSEDSIHGFFKLFFDEIVRIFYPKDYIFELSAGSGEWKDIDIELLRSVNANPNKNTLVVTSDSRIGDFAASNLGPYTITLTAFAKDIWTSDGKAPSSKPNIQRGVGTDVNKWIYTYDNKFTIKSTDSVLSEFPDAATWSIYKRDIDYADSSTQNREIVYTELVINPNPSPIDETIQLSLFGLDTESNDGLVTETAVPSNATRLVTEGYGGIDLIAQPSDIEYYGVFSVVAVPLFSTKIGDTIKSFENGTADAELLVYQSIDLSPVAWAQVGRDVQQFEYSNSKSFASDRYKLHDGIYWQKYSYEIKSKLPYEEWAFDYLRFVHPSGLKMFFAIVYEFIARTDWKDVIDYAVLQPQKDYSWLRKFKPPELGYHTPGSQPGWLTANQRLLTIIAMRLADRNAPESLLRMVQILLAFVSTNTNSRDQSVYEEYQRSTKFSDPNQLIAGFLNKTIAQASAPFSRNADRLLSNISSFVTLSLTDLSYYPWFYSELIDLPDFYELNDLNYEEAEAFDVSGAVESANYLPSAADPTAG